MKKFGKLFAVLLSLIIIICCAACSKTASKEDMLAVASKLDNVQFFNDVRNNPLTAEDKYLNNYYIISGYVDSVEKDCAKFSNGFTVYLNDEELKKINKFEKVEIVGEMISLANEEVNKVVGGTTSSATKVVAEVRNAYITNNTFEVTGKISMYYMDLLDYNGKTHTRTGEEDAWWLVIDDGVCEYHLEDAVLVEHHPGKDVTGITIDGTEVKNKDTITISGKLLKVNDELRMSDIKLVSAN